MTIPTQPTFNTYTADGTTTVFPYSFLLLSNNDLEVSIDGMTQARNVDYQITGTTNPDGGNVTFCTTPANASRILISRRLTLKRLSVSVDHDFDRIWQALQQLQRSTGGSIADHKKEDSPHPQYLVDHEGREIVAEGITAHTRDSDPHPQYLTDTEGDAKYLTSENLPSVASSAGFSNLKEENGYQKLPSGLIVQWGVVRFTVHSTIGYGGGADVTFSVAFPTACLNTFVSGGVDPKGESESLHHLYQVSSASNVSARISAIRVYRSRHQGNALACSWLAIGY